MWILVLFIVIAIILIAVLTIINMNSVSEDKKKEMAAPAQVLPEKGKTVEEETEAPVIIEEKNDTAEEPLTHQKMNDDAYRKVLQSFKTGEKIVVEDQKETNDKMKDDDFRNALKSLAGKDKK